MRKIALATYYINVAVSLRSATLTVEWMIDSVTLSVEAEDVHRRILEDLPGSKITVDSGSGCVTSISGRLNNLRVVLNQHQRLIVRGSLPKYAKGSNVEDITRLELAEVIGQLSDQLALDPSQTHVYAVEVGATLKMKEPVSTYLHLLGDASRYKRCTYQDEGVEYRMKRRSIVLYDKAKEAGLSTEDYLLRVEVQLKKRVERQLGRALMLSDLGKREAFRMNRPGFAGDSKL